jgi:AraC-like DNA-binding protein
MRLAAMCQKLDRLFPHFVKQFHHMFGWRMVPEKWAPVFSKKGHAPTQGIGAHAVRLNRDVLYAVQVPIGEAAVVRDAAVQRFSALPSATGGIARLAYARATSAGFDADLLLKKSGISREQIGNPAARLTVRDQINFLNLAAAALQDDLLGFHLALPAELREIGLLYYVSASSDTLREALQQAARYSSIVNEGVSLELLSGNGLGVAFRYVGVSRHIDRHQIEFFVTILVRVCRQLTGSRVTPAHVRLTHRRDTASSELFEFFGDAIEFGATVDEIVFAASAGQLPVVSADPYLNKILTSYCEEALSRRPINLGSFRSVVENTIVPLLPHGKARSAEVARRLGVSRRTFARRLSSEGTSFSEVSENLKSCLARRYLADESLSISKIAWLLGYQEVSAFTHAFKRWTGKAPRDARSSSQPRRAYADCD